MTTNANARRSMQSGDDPFWQDAPTLWDTVTLQGQDLPGRCRVTAKLGRKIEIKSPPGADGANLRDRGYEPARITVRVLLWTPDHFSAWEQSNISLIARGGRQRNALDISHPALNNMGVRQVYLESVTALEPSTEVKKAWESTLTLIEYSPPSARPAQAVQANSSGNSTLSQQQTQFDPSAQQNTPAGNGASAPSSAFGAQGG